ncbi:MAG TPA: DNA mismatch repair endonuclease MutL [Planctomycetota bacterium]|nr:DNA mismatch repair endonuclease MutL [Planctomycetota bacterium]
MDDSLPIAAEASTSPDTSSLANLQSPEATIHVLPPAVTSRIAAGEVVERPASVVKELAENALDAGASAIHIDIAAGGRQLIRVSDNGKGMSRTDLEMCVLPHATSKISSAEQLLELSTLGFRGEALPSIAAVSHFALTSRARSRDNAGENAGAWRIEIDGGEPEKPQARPASGAPGTSVEVKELFYNLPARAKFLKGAASEAAACADTLLRLALTRPDVAFTLRQDRHEVFSLPACAAAPASPSSRPAASAAPDLPVSAYTRRARDVLGRDSSKGLIELAVEGPTEHSNCGLPIADCGLPAEHAPRDQSEIRNPKSEIGRAAGELSDSYRGYRLYGLISPPAVTRPNRSQIYLTVNGRAVKDRLLTSALLESYRHLLPPKRYPAAVLFLECPGGDVDINVHPAKTEVRFRLPGLVYALFHHAVRSACGVRDSSASVLPGAAPPAVPPVASTPAKPPLGAVREQPGQQRFDLWPVWSEGGRQNTEGNGQNAEGSGQQPAGGTLETQESTQHTALATSESLAAEAAGAYSRPRVPAPSPLASRSASRERPAAQAPIRNPQSEIRNPQPDVSTPPVTRPSSPVTPFRVLGQAGGSYIVLEDDSGVRLIDQHALHERILFEELLARAEGRSRGDSQGLLIAETLELTPVQAAVFHQDDSAAAVLREIGFEVESFGPRALAVRAVPAILPTSAAACVRDVLEALAGTDDYSPGAKKPLSRAFYREKAAYILSCKGAIKAGERLTHEQMTALVAEFKKKVGGGAFTCPHGRPLALELSWEDLERAVGRR